MSWYLYDNKLTHADLGVEIPGDTLVSPYPSSVWCLNGINKIDMGILPREIPGGIFTPPYPASMWYLGNGDKLQNALLPESLPNGAFANNPNLTEVVLPASLSSIGRESFAWTGLSSVTIPNDQCTYYSTSFPEGCVVTGGHLIE